MPHCPVCKAEYEEGVLHCVDCRVTLLPGAPVREEEPLGVRAARWWKRQKRRLTVETPQLLVFTFERDLSLPGKVVRALVGGWFCMFAGLATEDAVAGWWRPEWGTAAHPTLLPVLVAIACASTVYRPILGAVLGGVLWGRRRVGYAAAWFVAGMVLSAYAFCIWQVPSADYWEALEFTSARAWLLRGTMLAAFCLFFGWLPKRDGGRFIAELATYAVIRGAVDLFFFVAQEPLVGLSQKVGWAHSVSLALSAIAHWLHPAAIALALGYCIGRRWPLWAGICAGFTLMGGTVAAVTTLIQYGNHPIVFFDRRVSYPAVNAFLDGLWLALLLAVLITAGHLLAAWRKGCDTRASASPVPDEFHRREE